MSYFDNTTTKEELQAFLWEKIENLAERVEYKNTTAASMKEVLNDTQYANYVDCGTFLGANKNFEVVAGNFCHHRLCPVCNRRYAAQKWHKIKNITSEIKTAISPVFALLTLTVKNVEAERLSEEITKLMKSIDRMHKTKLWKDNVLGFFRSLEVTYNAEAKTYHPHYHYILCLPPNYLTEMVSTFAWRSLWERSARLDYNSQIDIQIIQDEDRLSGGIAEVAKYAVKISSVVGQGQEALLPLVRAIKGRRLISYGGIIKDLAKNYDKASNKERAEIDRERLFDFVYRDGKYKLLEGGIEH